MIEEALAALASTDGVYGALVVEEGGRSLAVHLRPPHDAALLSDAVKRLSLAFDAISAAGGGEVASFFVECEDGALHLRHVDRCWIVTLTAPDVNGAVLNLAVNVVALNLSRGPASAGGRAAARGAEAPPAAPSSASGSSAVPLEIPADAVDRTIVQRLLVLYADYLGPAAKLVMKQQLAAMGATSRTLRRAQVGDLVVSLAARIPVPARQAEFAAAAREFRARLAL